MPFNSMPGGGPTITVEALLNQPRLISRQLTDLTNKRFVADKILSHGSPDQVAGGAALFQRSESIYPDGDFQEVMPRSEYPRTGWSEAILTAAVHKFGLEFPVSDEQRRRNALDVIARGQRKLANALVKFVDTRAMAMIIADPVVLTGSGSDWTTPGTDIIAEISTAITAIRNVEEGYEPDTLIVNPAQELDLLIDTDIRAALPRETTSYTSLYTGMAVPLLGLKQVLVSAQMTAGKAIILESGVVGTIVDEQPSADEGYTSYSAGYPNVPAIHSKTYRNENVDETIVRAVRWPAMWISEPKAAYVRTSI